MDPSAIKEKADAYSKFNVKKWRENIEGSTGKVKKAFSNNDNNIPVVEKAPSAAGSMKPPRGGENQVSMPEIKPAHDAMGLPQTRNLKSEWKVSNSLGLVGLTHSNGYP